MSCLSAWAAPPSMARSCVRRELRSCPRRWRASCAVMFRERATDVTEVGPLANTGVNVDADDADAAACGGSFASDVSFLQPWSMPPITTIGANTHLSRGAGCTPHRDPACRRQEALTGH